MLRKQLIGVIVMVAAGITHADDQIDSASATARAHAESGRVLQDVGHVLRDAEAMQSAPNIKQERNASAQAAPSRLGSIMPDSTSRKPIDIDAMLSKYGGATAQPSMEGAGEVLLVFISSSVPKTALTNLARAAAAVGAPLVLRGPVDGDFEKTAQFMRGIFGDEEGAIPRAMMDPTLFARFGVQQVPAFVVVPSGACVAGVRHCPEHTPDHFHVAGDVSLRYGLEFIARNYPNGAAFADALLARLEARQ